MLIAPKNIEFVYHGSWVEYIKDGDPGKPLTPSEKRMCDEIVEDIVKLKNKKNMDKLKEFSSTTQPVNAAYVHKEKEIDWEQRRYEIAKAMLPLLWQEQMRLLRQNKDVNNPYSLIVSGAVSWADFLIEELKK